MAYTSPYTGIQIDGVIGNFINGVNSGSINDGQVTSLKIATGSITTTKYATGSVNSNVLGDGSVTTEKINDYAVTEDKLSSGVVTFTKLGTEAVGTSKIQGGAVSYDKIDLQNAQQGTLLHPPTCSIGEVWLDFTNITGSGHPIVRCYWYPIVP